MALTLPIKPMGLIQLTTDELDDLQATIIELIHEHQLDTNRGTTMLFDIRYVIINEANRSMAYYASMQDHKRRYSLQHHCINAFKTYQESINQWIPKVIINQIPKTEMAMLSTDMNDEDILIQLMSPNYYSAFMDKIGNTIHNINQALNDWYQDSVPQPDKELIDYYRTYQI